MSVPAPAKTKAGWYVSLARYSTFEQVRGDVNIGERQLGINRMTAEHNKLTIKHELVAVDVSGRHVSDDPRFRKLFGYTDDPDCLGVIMAEQSRLFRPDDNKDYSIFDYFKKKRKTLFFPHGPKRLWIAQDELECRMRAAMDGHELSTLKNRTMSGKERVRANGGHTGGNHMLPLGIKYKRIRNDNGRVIRELYTVEPGLYEQMRRAFEYLRNGTSYDIAGAELSLPHYTKNGDVWGPVTGRGFKRAVTNPIWYGDRYYHEAAQGEEYQPLPRRPLLAGEKPPKKKRRRSVRGDDMDWTPVEGTRRGVLLVPVQLHDAVTLSTIDPLMTKEQFDAFQELVLKRAEMHFNRPQRDDPFLARKVLRCACGKRFYVRRAYTERQGHDWYYCSTCYHNKARKIIAKPCGLSEKYRRDVLDPLLVRMMTKSLLDAPLIAEIFRRADKSAAQMDTAAAERTGMLADLREQRQRILDDRFKGKHALLTADEARDRLRPIEAEIKALEARTPAAAPRRTDARAFVKAIARYFARYALKSIEKQRELLERAVSEIVVSGRGILSVTFHGGFLAAANIRTHSSSPLPTDACSRR